MFNVEHLVGADAASLVKVGVERVVETGNGASLCQDFLHRKGVECGRSSDRT